MVKAVSGRNVQRDRLMILLAYRHGLRVSELTDVRWSDVDFQNARLHVRRLKNGLPTTQPLQGDTLRLVLAHRYRFSPVVQHQPDLGFAAFKPL